MANFTKLTACLVLILGLTLLPTNSIVSKAHETLQDSLARRQLLLEQKLLQDRRQQELDRRIANFKATKDLLIKKGVPFDPNILMTLHWRRKLAPHFAQMPELQEVKIGPGKVKGVQLAHTLYLWQDTNHNGRSEPGELHTLAELGLTALSLDYKQSARRDQYGNRFLYRGRVQHSKKSAVERWAYDVFLLLDS